jgi:hypothetical protein
MATPENEPSENAPTEILSVDGWRNFGGSWIFIGEEWIMVRCISSNMKHRMFWGR